MDKKKQGDHFIEAFDLYCKETCNHNLIQEIIEDRKQTILSQLNHAHTGNLADVFSTDIAQRIIGKEPSSNLPSHYFFIEQLAQQIFGCLLSFWTELEIYRIIQHSALYKNLSLADIPQTYDSHIINEHYHYEIIPDIALDKRLFFTGFCSHPLLLSDAIVLINIETFIKEHKWYEMLTLLDISSKGEHFILYQFGEQHTYPNIISSALINSISMSNEWLFFNDFFQNSKWPPIYQAHSVSNLKNITKMETTLDINTLINKPSNYMESCFLHSMLNKDKACEAIRLTVSGEKSKANYHLYLAQKGLANALKNSGREIVFTIIEKPAMVLFYQSMNIDSPLLSPYLFTSSQDINKNGVITYKGLWLLNNAVIAFNQYNFKAYNVKIIELRKLLRNS
jgi:acyl homoserine lactone synthase